MTVAVNHDYPMADNLKVVNETGDPIEGATIRIYGKLEFDQGDVAGWIGETTTDINGQWVDPVHVADGETYVVHIQKETMYGPVHTEVTT